MSVHELCGLHKLRRIGLVRVNNLTDEAVYSLAERASTLERIHLSYCDQITVIAIHFLLDHLHKLTHLSLTGIPAFRQAELQQFCRPPPSVSNIFLNSGSTNPLPQDFNTSQRSAFCVYSGKGVSELRTYLTDLVNTMTRDMNPDDDTEYDEDYDDMGETTPDAEVETGNEGDDDEDFDRTPVHPHRPHSHSNFVSNANLASFHTRSPPNQVQPSHPQQPDHIMHRDRTIRALPASITPSHGTIRLNTQIATSTASATSRRTITRTFGQQPVIETSTSPTPSDVASNRSTGTNQSNGAFFRTYQEAATSSRSNGALTPDLNFAEIGHGRGADNGANSHASFLGPVRTMEAPQSFNAVAGPSHRNSANGLHPVGVHVEDDDQYSPMDTSADPPCSTIDGRVAWPQLRGGAELQSSSPTTRELHDSVHSAFANQPANESRDAGEGRGRRVKRSLRSTFSAAETFFFGRGGSNNAGQDENGGDE